MAKTNEQVIDELIKNKEDLKSLDKRVFNLRRGIAEKKDEHEINKVLSNLQRL